MEKEKDYKAKVAYSSRELTAREKIALVSKMSDAVKLDDVVTPEAGLILSPLYYAVVDVHNEKSENKDYTVLLLVDTDNQVYTTSSSSVMKELDNINDEMTDAGEEFGTYDIKIVKRESKNYKNKFFMTATIA